jgi:hypothetical protein
MLNHYVRRTPKAEVSLTRVESALCSLCPFDRLVVYDELRKEYMKLAPKEGDLKRFLDLHSFNLALENLIRNGYLKELNGFRLEKFIKDLP